MSTDPQSKVPDEPLISDADLPRVEEFCNRHRTAMLVVLFTDLAASTDLAERRGEVHAQTIRQRHDHMLREIIERDGAGECLKTIGDALMCIFAEPSAAVERAVEIQETLAHYNADHADDSAIRVRIGMHVGQVAIEDEVHKDVFGRHVNRAARVESLAQPGQILMTYPVYDSAAGWLAEKRLNWCDHGEYSLKGIPEPVRIVEIYSPEQRKPRAPRGTRHRRRPWLAWAVATAAVIAAIVLLVLLQFPSKPLASELRVEVVRDDVAGFALSQTLPHRRTDQFVFSGELSRPAHAALFWIDSTGRVQLVVDRSREKTDTVRFPEQPGMAVPIVGPPGADVVILVASAEPLETDRIGQQLGALGAPPSFAPEAPPQVLWFDRESVRFDPEYRAPGTPTRIGQQTPLSFAEEIRNVLRQGSMAFAAVVLRHD